MYGSSIGIKKQGLTIYFTFFRFRFTLLFLFITHFIYSQKYFGVEIDNDLFFGKDRYYSSGIFLDYGKLIQHPEDSESEKKYKTRHWTLGQEINTPRLKLTSELSKLDYPYNGWLYLGFEESYFRNLNWGFSWSVQMGTTGAEASLAKSMQNTYHRIVLKLKELTWAYSIPQAFHINAKIHLMLGVPLLRKIKFVQESQLQAGSFRTGTRTQLGFQWGTLRGLPFFGQRLEQIANGFSFLAGATFIYNYHDYSLSGSMRTQNSPFDFEIATFRNSFHFGTLLVRLPWKLKIQLVSTSSFVLSQKYKGHSYVKIGLSHLF
ncbi:MAG: lipid A-modifier LpxR family protein [Flavobacteriaceae bacterium]